MSMLTWISGLFVLLSILYRQIQVQEWDATLFRLLGAPSSGVLKLFQVEFGILVLAASLFGSLLAIAIGMGLSYQFFDGSFKIDWLSLGMTLGISSGLSLILTSFFSLRLARSNPARVLESVRL
jgi:predicted lysophospholipase L1 biosynthesis ABC-type transport system permease subunit